MHTQNLIVLIAVFITTHATALEYPQARKDTSVVDTYFGTEVADPYRWLEDDQSEETAAWVAAQNKVTRSYLDAIPAWEMFESRLTDLWNYERVSTPWREGENVFWRRNDGLQNQSVLYVAKDLPFGDDARILIDPNTLSDDGTVSLTGTEVSPDGRLLAYGTSSGGSDWNEWRIRNIETGEDLDDHLKWVKFSGVAWLPDNSAFFYSRYDEPKEGEELTGQNFFQKVYLHRVGTNQIEDQLIYQRTNEKEKEWGFGTHVTDDGSLLILNVWKGAEPKNALFYQRLNPDGSRGDTVELIADFEQSYRFIDNIGNTLILRTDLNAPLGRVIAIDLDAPNPSNWREIIPESDDKLEWVNHLGCELICEYLHHAATVMKTFSLDGKFIRDISLPGVGSVSGFGGRGKDTESYYHFSGFTDPGSIYQYNVGGGKSTLVRKSAIQFDSSPYETKQVFASSKDGTQIPIFLVHRKGITLDGSNPCVLYGYGGFNVSLGPGFSIPRAAWLEKGGVFAMAILRGGGEYGEDWHQAGTKLQKQNVFDDFIGCAEWLIDNQYTSTPKLAIEGGSNGGLLVGACMTQRPELFGAALPHVGVMDMLRYHKFTIGWAWAPDYGTSEESEEMFHYLHRYSPLHALRQDTAYPATMVFTADHDDRVVPAHSFKFAARLQDTQSSENPALIRIEESAGHGAGTPTSKAIEKESDRLAFLWQALGMKE